MESSSSRRHSNGCVKCRKAKKGCDLKRPTCGRCQRLNQACGGYADTTNEAYGWLGTMHSEPLVGGAYPTSPSILPVQVDAAVKEAERGFFSNEWTFLFDGFMCDRLVGNLIIACALTAATDSAGRVKRMRMGNELYTNALGAVREATLKPEGVLEDATLVASMLLANFERYSECHARSPTEWMIHVQGVSFLAENRGVHQTRTKLGKAIFRKARDLIIENALYNAIEAPPFVVLYSQAIRHDAQDGMDDQLAILETRAAGLFARYCSEDLDQKLGLDAETYQEDLSLWELDLDRAEEHFEQRGCVRGEQWQRIRFQTCMIICLRVRAAVYDWRRYKEKIYHGQAQKQSEVASRVGLTSEILRNSGAEIRMLDAARLELYRSTSSLRLTRHLHIIGVCLIDESRQTILERQTHAAHICKQMVSIIALLQHLGHATGDHYSLYILKELQLRQRRLSSCI